MKSVRTMALVLAALLILTGAIACSSKPKEDKVIKVGFDSTASLNDLPSLMAFEEFMPKGYKVETTFFSGTDVAAKAVISGEVDMGTAVLLPVIKLVLKGTAVKFFLTENGNEWQLITPSEIKTAKDLDRKRVAYHGPVTNNEALVKWYAKNNGISPEWLVIPGSENRAAALLKGQIEGTAAEVVDVVNLDKQYPGKYHVLADLRGAYQINTTFFTTDKYIKENKAELKAVTKAILLANRKANEDTEWAVKNALRLFPGSDEQVVRQTLEIYKKVNFWDANGHISKELVDNSMSFYKEAGLVEGDLKFEDWVDLSIVEEVLKDIGKK